MTSNPQAILDLGARTADFRRASNCAARAGRLRDSAKLERLSVAEGQIDAGATPGVYTLTRALSNLIQPILPMTSADPRFGRDPLNASNQRSAHGLQLCLATDAFRALLTGVHGMNSLRLEKAGWKAIELTQATQSVQKSIAVLCKMAQIDEPLAKSSESDDLVPAKVGRVGGAGAKRRQPDLV